jgi:hypothetical protein
VPPGAHHMTARQQVLAEQAREKAAGERGQPMAAD